MGRDAKKASRVWDALFKQEDSNDVRQAFAEAREAVLATNA